jgi:hypothetical protein
MRQVNPERGTVVKALMRFLVPATCLVLLVGAVGATRAPLHGTARKDDAGCPGPSKKTLTDHDAPPVSLTPVRSTGKALRTMPVAPGAGAGPPRTQPEQTTYDLRVYLVAARMMSDHDIHLLVSDTPGGATMITELPDTTCPVAASSPVAAQMTAARSALLAAIGHVDAAHWTVPNASAEITGVGFFDTVHKQRGVAPNGFELHPLLSLSLLSSIGLVSWTRTDRGGRFAERAVVRVCAPAKHRYRVRLVERAFPHRRIVRVTRMMRHPGTCGRATLRWRFPNRAGERRFRLLVTVFTPNGNPRVRGQCLRNKKCGLDRGIYASAGVGGGD